MTEGTKGHPAEFKARQNDQEYSMGDNLKAPAGSIVEFFTQVNTSDVRKLKWPITVVPNDSAARPLRRKAGYFGSLATANGTGSV
jgi:hypothetical protein